MSDFSLKEFCREISVKISAEQLVKNFFETTSKKFFVSTRVIALGKVSVPMLSGLDQQLDLKTDFIAVSPKFRETSFTNLTGQILTASHPIPDQNSFEAGEAVKSFIQLGNSGSDLLVLLSGGTSALIAKPAHGISQAEKIECHKKLVFSGLPISEINSVRRKISAIKGGKLLDEALKNHRHVRVCAISDVPSGLFHEIGSGPFSPDPEPFEKALINVKQIESFPENAVRSIEKQTELFNLTFFAHKIRRLSERYEEKLIFSQPMAATFVTKELESYGFLSKTVSLSEFPGSFSQPGQMAFARDVWLVACGEREIKVPETSNHGKGGRASHNLLSIASELFKAGMQFDLAILATDGKDGNSEASGGFISSEILNDGIMAKISKALEQFDSGGLLNEMGLAFHNFVSENNVGDIFLFRHRGQK